jgi:DNA-binding LacI/PurR family transcriptional regulator
MSFDQLDYYKNWSPRLAAVDNHPEQIGEEAGKLLVKMWRSEDTAERVVVPFQIVEGESL